MIAPLCYALNSTPSTVTLESPHYLLFGVRSLLNIDKALIMKDENPLEIQDRVRNQEEARKVSKIKSEQAQAKNQKAFNESHAKVPYKPGEKAYVKDPNRKKGVNEKMRKKWSECEIIAKENDGYYKIKIKGEEKVVGVEHLRKRNEREDSEKLKELELRPEWARKEEGEFDKKKGSRKGAQCKKKKKKKKKGEELATPPVQ